MNINHIQAEVDILVNGKPVKKYPHKQKIFVEAREGMEYTVRIKNNTIGKKLAICAIDGINVVNGEASGSNDTGYILGGFSSYEVRGFRTSNESVNAFKFSKKGESYAAKSEQTQGDTSNCGVIGVKIFQEKPITSFNCPPIDFNYRRIPANENDIPSNIPWGGPYKPAPYIPPVTFGDSTWDTPTTYSCNNSIKPEMTRSLSPNSLNINSLTAYSSDFDLGTEFSDKEVKDIVLNVEFEKGVEICFFEFFYASRSALLAMGVELEKKTSISFPSAFPSQFCKPPKT